MNFTYVDAAVAVVTLLSAFLAYNRGFTRELFAIGGWILAAFAAVSLLLAGMGISGVTALGVSRRNTELGVRFAMGAEPVELVGPVLKKGMVLSVAGMILGVLVAAAVSELATHVLFETPPRDPLAFSLVALLVTAVAVVSNWLPARRITRLDLHRALNAD